MPTATDKRPLPLVLDASAALRIVLSPHDHRNWIKQLQRASIVAAPVLFASETANALWKYQRAGMLDRQAVASAHEQTLVLVSHWQNDLELSATALQLAERFDHPVYDCLYLACAQRLDAATITADKRLSSLAARILK